MTWPCGSPYAYFDAARVLKIGGKLIIEGVNDLKQTEERITSAVKDLRKAGYDVGLATSSFSDPDYPNQPQIRGIITISKKPKQ